MSRPPGLSTTSYAVLGLLAVRPWSTYELTRQMDRSLGRIWPRAVSKLYEEPKKLAAHGLARGRRQAVGARLRTIYSITPRGRRALAAWLAEPPATLALESEHLVKIFFAEQGTREDALRTLAAAREWARERNEGNLAAGSAYLAGTGPFPERTAQTMLVGRFLTDFYALVADWADWATVQVAAWPDDPRGAQPDPAELADIVRRAESLDRATGGGSGDG